MLDEFYRRKFLIMKKLILAIILLTVSVTIAAVKPANFAGNWTLDKSLSKNLPKYYENISSHKLAITLDKKSLNVAIAITIGENLPDKFNFDYNLDGTESKTQAQIRTPNGLVNVPTTLKAIEAGDEKLQITITRELNMNGNSFKGVTVENWQLSADGKTLTIHKIDEMPQGKVESEMIFIKE